MKIEHRDDIVCLIELWHIDDDIDDEDLESDEIDEVDEVLDTKRLRHLVYDMDVADNDIIDDNLYVMVVDDDDELDELELFELLVIDDYDELEYKAV